MAAMPGIVAAAVLQKSDDSELKDTAACQGPDFDKDRSLGRPLCQITNNRLPGHEYWTSSERN